MAINKNFVVKNGLEVNTNLIVADGDVDRVGIGTTIPQYKLEVTEDIGSKTLYVGSSRNTFSVVTGPTGLGNSVGIGTSLPGYLLDIRSPVSTGQTAVYVRGDIRVTGISTIETSVFVRSGSIVVGTYSSTGTSNQKLQVHGGGAYISDNVGIGTTTPGAELHVVPQSDGIAGLFSGSTSTDLVRITQTGTGNPLVVEDAANPDSSPFVVSTVGNVGLATTNPTSKLHVVGDSLVTGISTFNNRVDIDTDLNVDRNVIVVGFSTFNSRVDIDTDLNVDRNVTVTGISTFTNYIDANGGAYIDNVQIGVSGDNEIDTTTGILTLDSFAGQVTVDDRLLVTGISTFNSRVDIDTDLNVDRNVTVTGISTFTNYIDANGGAYIDNIQIGISGDNEIDTTSGILTIDSFAGQVTVDDRLLVTGISTFNSDVYVPLSASRVGIGTTNPTSKIHVVGDVLVTGISTFNNRVDIDTDLNVDRNVTVVGLSTFNNRVDIDTDLNVDRNVTVVGLSTFNNRVDIDTDLNVDRNATITGISTFTNYIDANGGAYIDNVQIGVSGDNEIDTTSGILTIDSFAGQVTVDDRLLVTGISTFNNRVDIDTDLNVDRNVTVVGLSTFNSRVDIDTDLNVDRNLTVVGLSTFNSRVDIDTDLNVDRNVTVTGLSTFNNRVDIDTDLNVDRNVTVTGISTLTNGPLLIGSGTSTGTASQPLQVNGGGAYVFGSLGIGSTNPTSKLHVIGNALVSGIVTSSGFNATAGNDYEINNTSVLTSTTLGSGVVNSSLTSVGTLNSLNVSGISTFLSSQLKIRNPANTFEYGIAAAAIAANRTLNLPLITADDTVATLGLSQTFSGNITVSTGNIAHTGTTQNFTAQSYTTGTVTIGGALQTGAITLGQATTSQILNLATGVSAAATTKTINFGTGGASGSFTQINIGPTVGVGTITINTGTNLGIGSDAPTSKLFVVGDGNFTGVVTARTFSGQINAGVSTLGIAGATSLTSQNLNITGISTFAGITTVTGATLFTKQLNTSGISTFGGDVLPSIDATYNIGSPSKRWSNFYVDNITGTLVGGAATVAVISDTQNATRYLTFFEGVSGVGSIRANTNLAYNPGTIVLSLQNGSLLIGSGTSTGTASQPLQVSSGGAYVFGNLGVGVTNPSANLQLSPNATISNVGTGITLPGTVGSALTVAQFVYLNNNTTYLRIKATRNETGSSWTSASTKLVNVTDLTEQGYIEYNPNGANGGMAFGQGSTEWARFLQSGNAGIGTTNPLQRFQVGVANALGISTNGRVFVVTDNGDAGIGTTNPVSKLHVVGNALVSGIVTSSSFNLTTGNDYTINNTSVLNATTLGSGVVNSSLTSVGTLGTLNVSGVTTTGILRVGTGGTIIATTLTGNTGIGTITPTSKLHVVGDALVSGIVTSSGFNATTGNDYEINNTSVLNATTLGSGVVNSSLTSVGTLTRLVTAGLVVTGITTLGVTTATNLLVQNINNFGITTTNSLNIGATEIVSSSRQLQNIASLDATTTATIESAIINAPNNFNDLRITGISTFTNGPVLIGSGTSTGTASQTLQVNGASAYISGSLGIGSTNPTAKLDVAGLGQFVNAGNQLLLHTGTNVPTVILRNDGSEYYHLLSAAGTTPSGTFNSLRPLAINLTSGAVAIANTAINIFNVTNQTASAARWLVRAVTTGISNEAGIYQDASNNMQFAARDGSGTLRLVLDSNNTSGSYLNTTAGFSVGKNTTTPGYTDLGTNLRIGVANKTGTYVMVGTTTVTVTCTNHGLTTGDSVYIDYSTGTAVDSYYNQVTVTDSNTFTVVAATSLTTNGACSIFSESQIRFPGANGDSGYNHTVISERLYGASDKSELLIFKGNDTGTSIQDNIRLAATGDIYFHTGLGVITYDGYINSFGNNLSSSTVSILSSGNLGVGITNPTSKLHVVGNTLVSGIITSGGFNATTGNDYEINNTSVLNATTLGSGVVNSSLTSVGTLNSLNVSGISTFAGITTVTGATLFTKQLNASGIVTSGGFNATTGNDYKINNTSVLTSTTLGSGVVNSSLTSVGTLGSLNVSGISTFAGITTVTGTTLFAKQLNVSGVVTASSFIRPGGTSSQFLKADGSIDSNTYSTATALSVSDDTSTDATRYILFEDATSGTISSVNVSSTNLQFNPSTGNLSATILTSLSDQTQKTNIRPIENAIDLVKQLEGVRYDWINNNKPSIGVIAQEIEKVLPEVVETSNSGLKSVSYGNIIGVLIEAIKEQNEKIDKLQKIVDNLK